MNFEDDLNQVLERWKEAFGQYSELKAEALPSVMRWEWAAGERYSPLPYYFKRYPGRARALKAPPSKPGHYIRSGFDETDRPRVQRFYWYLDLDGEARFQRDLQRGFERDDLQETFYRYTKNLTEIIEFSVPPRIPLKVQQIYYEDGRVIRHASFRVNGYTPLYSEKGRDPEAFYKWLGPNGRFKQVEIFKYDGDHLTSIIAYRESPGAGQFKIEEQLTYDSAGSLDRIERIHEPGNRQLVYLKRKEGQTFQSIADSATHKLIEAIVERLRVEDIRGRLCCIELSYESPFRHFPPILILGYESDRQRMLESGNPNAVYFAFAPALIGKAHYLEITDPEVLEICGQFEGEIQRGSKWKAARRALRQTASTLTRYDWRGILDVTKDFVVFAIDWEMEGDRIEEVLHASVDQEQIREWKRKGWL